MATKPRYMKLRGSVWHFQLGVPERHRGWVGKPVLQGSLKTSDRALAQTRANAMAAEWQEKFIRAERGPANLNDAWRDGFDAAARNVDRWKQMGFGKDDLEAHKDLLLDHLLEREAARQGVAATSEIVEEDVPLEIAAEIAGARAAVAGAAVVPPEFRRPFSKLAEAYLSDRQRLGSADRLTEQTVGQMQVVYRLFSDHMADAALGTVKARDAAEFFDKIKQLPSNWGRSPKTKERSLADLLELAAEAEGVRLTDRTLFRYMVALSQVWEWASKRDEVTGKNPFSGQLTKGAGSGKSDAANTPWTDAAIKAYFSAHPDASSKGAPDPMHWVPRIALLSGMRLEEICGLEADQLTKIDGVLCFDIRKGKTETSVRPVPVHTRLLPLLKVAPQSGFVFPNLKPGGPDEKRSWNLGKQLGRTFRSIPGGSTFHGFRKTVAQSFERAGVAETSAALILGHRRNDITYGIYSPHGLRMAQRKEIVDGLRLPKGA